MCDLIAHRGPDGDGVWTDGPVGLGHRRLAVIDLSAGRPPADDRRPTAALTITFNGEIYNFLELRRDLEARGHRFRSKTDTEVMLAAVSRVGRRTACRASAGMFAFALWDAEQRTLFVARDRVGKKPLHYWIDRDGLAFASEPKAFLADPAFTPEPDLEALSAYLNYQYVPSPLSAFKGVRKLPPGALPDRAGRPRDDRALLEAVVRDQAPDLRGRRVRGAARPAARGRAAAPHQRRAARRVPQRRHRLERRRRADGRA